jgi:hypothetical protein
MSSGNRTTGTSGICRRDPVLRRPYAEVVRRGAAGIPYLAPEIVLLFKAKHARAKDEDDLAAIAPRLDLEQRRWLRDALERVHPGHRWLEVI